MFEACGLDPRTKSTRKNEKTLLAVLKAKGFASGPPTRINGKVTATYLLRYKNLSMNLQSGGVWVQIENRKTSGVLLVSYVCTL